jgi:hypothetical protein
MWTVPLYLWASELMNDTVVLPANPSQFISLGFGDNVYSVVDSEPVAFVHTLEESQPSYPLVSLKLYFSEKRQDLVTSGFSEMDFNLHHYDERYWEGDGMDGDGGDYEWVADVGLVAYDLSPGATRGYVPLRTSYDALRSDGVTTPLSSPDLNLLAPLTQTLGVPYGSLGFENSDYVGYARHASCSFCGISMSETFPSAGGADCAYNCPRHAHSCHGGSKWVITNLHPKSESVMQFTANMEKAGDIISSFGDADISSGDVLHISNNYFCCYSEADLKVIKKVFVGFDWPTHEVAYDQAVVRIDSDGDTADHWSYIVLLDEASQGILHAAIARFEEEVREAGVDIHVPRADQEPFHTTLAVVSGHNFPTAAALQAVNGAIPPATWSPAGPITLHKPDLNY